MDWLKGFAKQLRALVRRSAVDRELDEEIAFHLEQEMRLHRESGLSPEEARRRAHIAFGGVERYRERVSEVRRVRPLEDFLTDIRYAMRGLRRRPGFAAAAILTLGLGIGGTTAIFSVVDGLFMRMPDGVSEPGDVRKIYVQRDSGMIQSENGGPGSFVDYTVLRDGTRAFTGIAAFISNPVDLGRGESAERVRATGVTHRFFEVLGVRTALGRSFTAEEDASPGKHPVVVLSDALWRTRFGAARDVLGQMILVNGIPLQVIGVTERGFTGLEAEPTDIWYPTAMAGPLGTMVSSAESDWRTEVGMMAFYYVARLRPGISDDVAAADAAGALTRAAAEQQGLDRTPGALTMTLRLSDSPYKSQAEDLSLWVALVSALVLIIACANVANLLLARGITRRREIAVRLSLGAARGRLARQHLAENLLLGVFGGATGLLIAQLGLGLIRQFPLPPSAGRIDARLLGFTLAVSLLTGLLFGLLPILRSARENLITGLRDSKARPSLARSYARRALVSLQVALCFALLVGAALFVRSLRNVHAIDPGVDTEHLLITSIDLAKAGLSKPQIEDFYARAADRMRTLPYVERVAMVHFGPFDRSGMSTSWDSPDKDDSHFSEGPYLNLAGPEYFRTTGTRVLLGREFDRTDASAEPRAIVNEIMARAIAPGGNVVGMCIPIRKQVREGGCTTIIGVIENQRRYYLDEPQVPLIYLARDQSPDAIKWGGPALVVRTRGAADQHRADVRAVLQSLQSDLPFVQVETVAERISSDVLPFKLGATLFSLFGALALILSAIGLYGVLAFFVMERTHEIGIRRAIGAPTQNVITLVLLQGITPVLIGLGMGLALAATGSRFIASLLFGVETHDNLSFALSAAFLLTVALAAIALPARRAARLDPVQALRED